MLLVLQKEKKKVNKQKNKIKKKKKRAQGLQSWEETKTNKEEK